MLGGEGVLDCQRDAEIVKFGAYTTACRFAPVDHAGPAKSRGLESVRITAPGDMADALMQALRASKPWLIAVMTDPEAHPALSPFDGTLDHADA